MDDLSDVERLRMAELHLDLGDPRSAASVLEPLTDRESGSASVHLLLGRAYFAQASLSRAERQFALAVGVDPSDHWARYLLGRALERQSRLIEARAQYRLATALHQRTDYIEALDRVQAQLDRRQ